MKINPMKDYNPQYPEREKLRAGINWKIKGAAVLAAGALITGGLGGCRRQLEGDPLPPSDTRAMYTEELLIGEVAPPSETRTTLTKPPTKPPTKPTTTRQAELTTMMGTVMPSSETRTTLTEPVAVTTTAPTAAEDE